MVPPGRKKKGPRAHFQFTSGAQAEAFKVLYLAMGMKQGEAVEEAIQDWINSQGRAIERAVRGQEEEQ